MPKRVVLQKLRAGKRSLTFTGHSCCAEMGTHLFILNDLRTQMAWQHNCNCSTNKRRHMLRVELRDSLLKLEGRLTGADAEHVRALMTRSYAGPRMVVDLTEVTFVDSVGEAVLSLLGRLGAEFMTETAYSFDVCERLQLPLARNGNSQKQNAIEKGDE
jgi:anti-anti-sigma regulatory factor